MKTTGRKPSTEPVFAVRRGTLDDAAAMGRIAYRIVDLEEERATRECRRIVREPFAFSAVATRRSPGGPERVVGVINGVLLLPWFSAHLFQATAPYFHHHVRDAPLSPFPGVTEVGEANAGEGLDLFLAHYAMDDGLSVEDAVRVRLMLVFYFAEQFAGNRLRSILAETVGRENTAMAQSGGFEVLNTFPAWRAERGVLERDGPHLSRITLEGAMGAQTLHLARLLQHRPPVFRFPSGARELLRFAVQGVTDAQLTEERGMSARSIASGWNRIYRIVEDALPSLFSMGYGTGKSSNRLSLLAYLRHHPEELWPYG